MLDKAAVPWGCHVAVSDEREELTYRELDERSRACARRLGALGVGRGDRVVLCLRQGVDLAVLVYACSRLGAAFVVLGTDTPPDGLEFVLTDCRPAALVTHDPALGETADRHGVPVHTPEIARGGEHEPGPDAPSPVVAVDPACLIYTSGSTAQPKAVVSDHSQVVFAATSIQRRLRYHAGDRVLLALPMAFDYGLYQLFLCTLAGATLHVEQPERANHALVRVLAERRITVLPAVPMLAHLLCERVGRGSETARAERRTALASLRLLTSTGAAMPASVPDRLRQHLPGLHVQLMYGLTECKRVSITEVDEDLRHPGSSGRPLDGTEVYAIDAAGRRLPTGQTGELVVRGPNVMLGYWGAPEQTRARFPVGDDLVRVLRTGDAGFVDADGGVHCLGRLDDVYKQNGVRVSITEVESAADRIPRVRAASVVPGADALTGATLFAVTDAAPHEVLDALRVLLPESKVPSRCVVVDTLPQTDRGKVDRSRLAAQVVA